MENTMTTAPVLQLKTNKGLLKTILLSIITFGIYGFWLSIKMKKWIVKHTHTV